MEYVNPNEVKNKLDYPLFYKESFLLFAVLVAGKSSKTIMKKTNELIADIIGKENPKSLYDHIMEKYSENEFEALISLLKKHKTGKYTLLKNFFKDIKSSKINLKTCSIIDLESLRGVGKKSSRFFMVYNRADQKNCAILDVHILKFLRANGIEAPEQTPSGKKYDELECLFLELLEKVKPKMTLQEMDFKIWYEAKENDRIPYVSKSGELIFLN